VQFREDKAQASTPSREKAVNRIAIKMAGLAAREKVGDKSLAGLADDMRAATQIAEHAILDDMLVSSSQNLRLMVQGGVMADSVINAEIQKLMELGEEQARRIVEERWAQIQETQKALVNSADGSLDDKGIHALVQKHGGPCDISALTGPDKPAPKG
jgi:ATP-dependent Zn protease